MFFPIGPLNVAEREGQKKGESRDLTSVRRSEKAERGEKKSGAELQETIQARRTSFPPELLTPLDSAVVHSLSL